MRRLTAPAAGAWLALAAADAVLVVAVVAAVDVAVLLP
jgi:hypothetical protein